MIVKVSLHLSYPSGNGILVMMPEEVGCPLAPKYFLGMQKFAL